MSLRRAVSLGTSIAIASAFAVFSRHSVAHADPTTVYVPGTYDTLMGCSVVWDETCANVIMTLTGDGIYRFAATIPATGGSGATTDFLYKVSLNGTWDVSYGANSVEGGGNLGFTMNSAGDTVLFYFDPNSHWVVSDHNTLPAVIAVAAGDFQQQLGCTNNWDGSCFKTWLEDPNGTGVYTFSATLNAGHYETKAALNESSTSFYPAGAPADVTFDVATSGTTVTFSLDSAHSTYTVSGATIDVDAGSAVDAAVEAGAADVADEVASESGVADVAAEVAVDAGVADIGIDATTSDASSADATTTDATIADSATSDVGIDATLDVASSADAGTEDAVSTVDSTIADAPVDATTTDAGHDAPVADSATWMPDGATATADAATPDAGKAGSASGGGCTVVAHGEGSDGVVAIALFGLALAARRRRERDA